MAEKNEIPALEALTEEDIAQDKEKDFEKWHDGHMERVREGLEKIIASEDLAEIKEIAKALLEEEKEEGKIEQSSEDSADVNKDEAEMSMEDYLRGK
jgi:hypothetical protein